MVKRKRGQPIVWFVLRLFFPDAHQPIRAELGVGFFNSISALMADAGYG